jgi:hypothetical protein
MNYDFLAYIKKDMNLYKNIPAYFDKKNGVVNMVVDIPK